MITVELTGTNQASANGVDDMKIKFTAPTKDFPFYSNVKVITKSGIKKVVSFSDDMGKMDAIFPSKEEMIAGVKGIIASK